MEGDKKRVGLTGSKRKKQTVNTSSNQEYDFFVIREEGGTVETDPPDHSSVKVKKRGGRNKNTSFLLSD
jgi:hypothetical protein